jgi:Ca2+-transporting ATPase
MDRPPRDPREPIIDRPMWVLIGVIGAVTALGTVFVLDAALPGGLTELAVVDAAAPLQRARTLAFTTLVLFEILNVFNCLDPTATAFRMETLRNRWLLGAVGLSLALQAAVVYWGPLQRGFDTVPLSAGDWLLCAGVASTVIAAAEAVKRTPWVRSPAPDGERAPTRRVVM